MVRNMDNAIAQDIQVIQRTLYQGMRPLFEPDFQLIRKELSATRSYQLEIWFKQGAHFLVERPPNILDFLCDSVVHSSNRVLRF